MNITVNGKEYILEYTFEAAECHECIDAAMDIFGGMMTAKIDSKHSEEMQVRDFQIYQEWQWTCFMLVYWKITERAQMETEQLQVVQMRDVCINSFARKILKMKEQHLTMLFVLLLQSRWRKMVFSSEPEWKTFWRIWRVWSRANRRNSRRNRWIISGRSQPKRRKQQWKRERRAKKTIFRADLGRISAKSFAVWLSV